MGKKTALPTIKIAVVGSSGVGKYSLSQQYAKGWIQPKDTNGSTEAACPSKVIQHENHKFEVSVLACRDLDSDDVLESEGVAMVFSVTDKASFTYAKTTAYKKLHEKFGAKRNGAHAEEDKKLNDIAETPTGSPIQTGLSIPIVLIGNKVDDATLNRQVNTEVGKSLSHDLSCVGFFETSAPCNTDVPKAFGCLLTEIINRRNESANTSEKKMKATNTCCAIS